MAQHANFSILGRIQEAVAAAPGASMADVVQATGLPRQPVSQSMYRAVLRGHLFAIKQHGNFRYFATAALRDAAQQEQAAAPCPRGTVQAAIVQAIESCTDPLGALHCYLVERTGLTDRQVIKAIYTLRAKQVVFAVEMPSASRYFSSASARDAAAPAALEAREAEIKDRRRANNKAYAERVKASGTKRVRKDSPAPRAASAGGVAAPVTVRKTPAQQWANANAIVPPHVKVTKCPGYVGRQFEPPKWFRGPFTEEWIHLRAST